MIKNEPVRKILRILLCFFFLSTTALAAPPVPFFFGTPQEGTAPLTVLFTDASDGDVSTWTWNFGDSATSRQKNTTHQYNVPGYYSVTLAISGPEGTDTITRLGYIFVSEPDPQEGEDSAALSFGDQHENDLLLGNKLDSAHNQEEKTTPTSTPDPIPEET
ncbi:MAG: PKD domain-containing protein, partial [Methanomicrobiales archaeon]|nr:PKD domain-containing protein [Methanomicrobiales archaeon]